MTTQTWNFNLDGQPHTLIIERQGLVTMHKIFLDGQLMEIIPYKESVSGTAREFQIAGHSLFIVIQSGFSGFVYDLLLDGVSLITGKRGVHKLMNNPRQNAILGAVFMLCIGLGISWYMKSGYEKKLVIQEWPVVAGQITHINTEYHPDSDDDDQLDDEYYYAILTIEYVMNNSRFKTQLEDDQHFDTSNQALTTHMVGEKQALYVNSSNPLEVHLYFEKLQPNGWVSTFLITMGVFTGLAILILFAVWRQTEKTAPALEKFPNTG